MCYSLAEFSILLFMANGPMLHGLRWILLCAAVLYSIYILNEYLFDHAMDWHFFSMAVCNDRMIELSVALN